MSNDLTVRRPRLPGPDDSPREDRLLMHDLTVLNTQVGRYVLRFLDADSGRATSTPTTDELALADSLTAAADAIRARALRREQDNAQA
jgi:hypothetical protein